MQILYVRLLNKLVKKLNTLTKEDNINYYY